MLLQRGSYICPLVMKKAPYLSQGDKYGPYPALSLGLALRASCKGIDTEFLLTLLNINTNYHYSLTSGNSPGCHILPFLNSFSLPPSSSARFTITM